MNKSLGEIAREAFDDHYIKNRSIKECWEETANAVVREASPKWISVETALPEEPLTEVIMRTQDGRVKEFKTIRRLTNNGDGPLNKLGWDGWINLHLKWGWSPIGAVYMRELPFAGSVEHLPLIRNKPWWWKLEQQENELREIYDDLVKKHYSK